MDCRDDPSLRGCDRYGHCGNADIGKNVPPFTITGKTRQALIDVNPISSNSDETCKTHEDCLNNPIMDGCDDQENCRHGKAGKVTPLKEVFSLNFYKK